MLRVELRFQDSLTGKQGRELSANTFFSLSACAGADVFVLAPHARTHITLCVCVYVCVCMWVERVSRRGQKTCSRHARSHHFLCFFPQLCVWNHRIDASWSHRTCVQTSCVRRGQALCTPHITHRARFARRVQNRCFQERAEDQSRCCAAHLRAADKQAIIGWNALALVAHSHMMTVDGLGSQQEVAAASSQERMSSVKLCIDLTEDNEESRTPEGGPGLDFAAEVHGMAAKSACGGYGGVERGPDTESVIFGELLRGRCGGER